MTLRTAEPVAATTHVAVDFFGCGLVVGCSDADAAELRFFFGPHVGAELAEPPADRPSVRLAADGGFFRSLLAKDLAAKTFTVRDAAGEVVETCSFRDWSSVTSPLPPFRLLADRVCVVQATVLTRDGTTVALIGDPYSGKTSVGLALARRGWILVSDQLMVVERATGYVRPYCVPVGLRRTTLANMRRAGLVRGATRTTVSEVTGEVVLVRPEALSAPIHAGTRLRSPRLVHVRRGGTGSVTMTVGNGARLRIWPHDAVADLRAALADDDTAVLRLPEDGQPNAAAELVESNCG